MSTIDDQAKKDHAAIRAIIELAASNFPASSDITIRAEGANCGSVRLPAYRLSALLRSLPDE